jgi:aminoglycoside phosphotransferase (APT) family kinase protein
LPLPHDPHIPVLDAIRTRGIGAVLALAGVSAYVTAITVLKHHASRCTLLLNGGDERFVLKAWDVDPAPLVELHELLDEHGLASGSAPTVAPMLGYDRNLAFVVQAWLNGRSAHELLADGAGARAGELGAAWLRAVWESGIAAGPRRGPREVLDELDANATALGRQEPALVPAVSAVMELLERVTPPGATRPVLQHGTFRTDQLIDIGDGPGVLDWDSFGRGALEHDAGTFLAWLSYSGTARSGAQATQAAVAARTFATGLDGVDDDALAWYRAAALVKFAGHSLRRRSSRRFARAESLLREARVLLSAG